MNKELQSKINQIKNKVNKEAKKKIVRSINENYEDLNVEWWKLDSPTITYILGKGLPKDRMIEIYGVESCLDKDTFIQYDVYDKLGKKINSKGGTIKRLYERFHKNDVDFYVSSVNDEKFIIKNKVFDVVKTGEKPCFCLETENGEKIVCTAEHKFLTDSGYVPLSDLEVGSSVYIHKKFLSFTVNSFAVAKITPIGIRETYDLKCLAPYNNYVANKFVVHNSGKTTIATWILGQVQKQGGICAFIDAEHSFDPEHASKFCDVDSLLISQPDCGEEALDTVEDLVNTENVDCIVIDSVSALTPRAEIEGDMGQSHMGLQARLMSQACRKLTGICKKTKTSVIWINQLRCLDENTVVNINGNVDCLKNIKIGDYIYEKKVLNVCKQNNVSGISLKCKYSDDFNISLNHKQPVISCNGYEIKLGGDIVKGDWLISPIRIESSNARGKYDVIPNTLVVKILDEIGKNKDKPVSGFIKYQNLNVCRNQGINFCRKTFIQFLDYMGMTDKYKIIVDNKFYEVKEITSVVFDAVDIEVDGDGLFIADKFLTHNSKIGVMYGSNEVTSGGNALKYYASIRLDVRRGEKGGIITDKNGEMVGFEMKIKTKKNKVSAGYRNGIVRISIKDGYQIDSEYFEFGVKYGFIQKSGAWYSNPETGEKLGQGKDNAIIALKDMPELYNKIKKRVDEQIAPGSMKKSDLKERKIKKKNDVVDLDEDIQLEE